MICTTVKDDLQTLEEFSKAKYIVIIDEKNYEIVYREENPALSSPLKRPAVAKECVKLKADKVIAPHGSLCYPSYKILRNAKIEILVSNRNDNIKNPNLKEVSIKEVIYSSFLAISERIKESI